MTLAMAGALMLGCSGLEQAAEQWAEDMQPIPPPAALSEIVGAWEGDTVSVVIDAEGMLAHERQDNGVSTRFNAPILVWSDASFTAGIGPMTQTFVINSPPTLVDAAWTMTLDSHVLTRQ